MGEDRVEAGVGPACHGGVLGRGSTRDGWGWSSCGLRSDTTGSTSVSHASGKVLHCAGDGEVVHSVTETPKSTKQRDARPHTQKRTRCCEPQIVVHVRVSIMCDQNLLELWFVSSQAAAADKVTQSNKEHTPTPCHNTITRYTTPEHGSEGSEWCMKSLCMG
jgi:hypothetical protein